MRSNDSQPNPDLPHTHQRQEEDLVDLPEEKNETKTLLTRVVAPKVIILGFLSLMFISKNIYNIYFNPNVDNTTSARPEETWQQFFESQWQLVDRMGWYLILTVALTTFYFMLVRSNDRALAAKMKAQEEQKEKKEKQEKDRLKAHEESQDEQFQRSRKLRNQSIASAQQQNESETKDKKQ